MTAQATSSFDLDEYWQRQCAVVDPALEHYLSHYTGASQTLYQAMRYGVFPGGKRIRPILTLAAGELLGRGIGAFLVFCLRGRNEMIHVYSLIHDDLPALDDEDLRRGAPAVHKIFGAAKATAPIWRSSRAMANILAWHS
jgi:geranylgeranyl diphosphate synthase, type II